MKIRDQREAAGLSLREAGKLARIDYSVLAGFERGEVSLKPIDQRRLQRVLNDRLRRQHERIGKYLETVDSFGRGNSIAA